MSTLAAQSVDQAAWSVADAAIAAAYDATVAATFVEFHERFPTVDALMGVYVESESGTIRVQFGSVRIGDRIKHYEEVKPENAQGIDRLLTERLGGYDLAGHIQGALDRATSDDGLLWIAQTAGLE